MTSKQSVFKGAFGWDDWVWWVAIGCAALLILLLLVCCCVCMQRAKRKGHEEALASVQNHQRLTQERERAEQQQQQQQRSHQAQQTRDATFATHNGSANGYQPAFGYPKQVTAVPRNLGSQVSYAHQFAKPNPVQQEGQATGQISGHVQRYQGQRTWYGADHGQSRSPIRHGDMHTSSRYLNNHMRFNGPIGGGGTNEVPFVSVRSPSASKSSQTYRKNGDRLQNHAAFYRETKKQIQAPVAVPSYTRASPSPAKTRASTDIESGTSGGTLQSRIDALRSADTNDMVHSRISLGPTDLSYSLAKAGGALGTIGIPGTLHAQESYASGIAGRSGLLASNGLSLNSSTLSNSLLSSPSSSLHSGDSYETLHPGVYESTKSMVLGDALTHGSSRSIGSDYSYGQYEDTGSFGPGDRDFKRQNSSNEYSTTSGGLARGDNVSFNSHGSVEF